MLSNEMSYKGENVPSLSVVIASYCSRRTIQACLRSLENQTRPPSEIILVDSGSDGTAELVVGEFPHVRLFSFSERKYPGDARNIALQHATGDVIAFLDADCVADPNWAEEILLAHQNTDALIGGAVDNANPESLVGWAAYFCEFSQWMPGTKPRYMIEVPTNCLSIKRWAFEKYGPFLEGTYCSDSAFNWRAGADGQRPWFQPAIRVLHHNLANLGRFLAKQVMHGRAFATVRIQEQNLAPRRTAILWLGSPLLPLLLFSRLFVRVLKNRAYVSRFIQVSPIVSLGLTAWSWGECQGYRKGQKNLYQKTGAPESLRRSAWQ